MGLVKKDQQGTSVLFELVEKGLDSESEHNRAERETFNSLTGRDHVQCQSRSLRAIVHRGGVDILRPAERFHVAPPRYFADKRYHQRLYACCVADLNSNKIS